MTELKPCPFCGCEAALESKDCWEAFCTGCYVSITADPNGPDMADTKWNRRASDEDEADAYNQGFADARAKAFALVDRWSMPGDPAYEIQSLMPEPPEET